MDRKDKLFVVNEVGHIFTWLFLPFHVVGCKLTDLDVFFSFFKVCEIKNCNKCIFFEAKKKQDLYMW